MKKNKMMRLASSLLVAVLLTSSVISGTFAKYVTSDSATDTARVAKWGVTVEAKGDLFANTYFDKNNGNGPDFLNTGTETTLSVVSSDKVVAPGTENDTGLTFTITGTPEVDVKFTVEMTGTDYVYLAQADNLPDYTTYPVDTFNLSDAYEPIKFFIAVDGATIMEDGNPKAYSYTGLQAYFNSDERDEAFDAGETIDTTYKITWAWDFDDNGLGTNDKADTLLGNLAVTADDGITYSTAINLGMTITVTQVD